MPPHTPQSPQERAGLEIARRLRAAGHETYWAGGWTRDYLLGLPPADVDIATGARPEDIARLFEKTVFVGAKFGVCRVTLEGATLEAATFRREGAYSDHRRPDSVEFATAEEDARRRDFTINAIFYDPLDGALIDWTGGRADLQARRLRCVGDPDRRFAEDALRILRAIRFAARWILKSSQPRGTRSAPMRLNSNGSAPNARATNW
jgi:poly(A) polymerase